MILHLSPACLSLVPHSLPVRCGCSGLHDSTLVSYLSPTLSHLSPFGCLGRMVLHLSPVCLPFISHYIVIPWRILLHLSSTFPPSVFLVSEFSPSTVLRVALDPSFSPKVSLRCGRNGPDPWNGRISFVITGLPLVSHFTLVCAGILADKLSLS